MRTFKHFQLETPLRERAIRESFRGVGEEVKKWEDFHDILWKIHATPQAPIPDQISTPVLITYKVNGYWGMYVSTPNIDEYEPLLYDHIEVGISENKWQGYTPEEQKQLSGFMKGFLELLEEKLKLQAEIKR